MLNVVLIEPRIPQNVGNIARTCAVTGARLHLVEPMGFTVDDKKLKRAGLDYWHFLDITYYSDTDSFFRQNEGAEMYFFSTKAAKKYSDVTYPDEAFLIFGREDAGIKEDILRDNYDRCVRFPMREGCRSLNLSNSVAIAVYEALRQTDFEGLTIVGRFPGDMPD